MEPHVEFIHQVMEKISSAKEAEAQEELLQLHRCVKMFLLGPPNSCGEPTPGVEQVVVLELF